MLSFRWITRFAIAFCCALALAAPLQAQTILRVDGDSGLAFPNPPPGDSWNNAFKFLQDALDEAAISEPPVQIWVAATVETNPYRPGRDADNPQGTADREATFNLISKVEIYGGFLGTDHPVAPETQLSQRDPEANETVLSGDLDDVGPPCGPVPDPASRFTRPPAATTRHAALRSATSTQCAAASTGMRSACNWRQYCASRSRQTPWCTTS